MLSAVILSDGSGKDPDFPLLNILACHSLIVVTDGSAVLPLSYFTAGSSPLIFENKSASWRAAMIGTHSASYVDNVKCCYDGSACNQ